VRLLEQIAKWLTALMVGVALATAASAQLARPLPQNGKLGEVFGQRHPLPLVQIGNEVLRLAPGGLIYDQHNRTIVHGHLPDHAYILFVQAATGEVTRIYILRPDELEAIRRAAGR